MSATAFYNTPEKIEVFKGNVSDLVADGFSPRASIMAQASIDLFIKNLFSNPALFITPNGTMDYNNIYRLSQTTIAQVAAITAGL